MNKYLLAVLKMKTEVVTNDFHLNSKNFPRLIILELKQSFKIKPSFADGKTESGDITQPGTLVASYQANIHSLVPL